MTYNTQGFIVGFEEQPMKPPTELFQPLTRRVELTSSENKKKEHKQ